MINTSGGKKVMRKRTMVSAISDGQTLADKIRHLDPEMLSTTYMTVPTGE